MEGQMRDLALQAAGALAILVAVAHGCISELKMFPNTQIAPRRVRTLVRMVWHASTVDWLGVGVLLLATPALGSETARQWVVALAVVVYGYAALANAVATRGRHFGWCLMVVVVALSLLGL
jgi:hypothetical protein